MGSFLDVLPIVKPFCLPDARFIETGTYKGEGLLAVMKALELSHYDSIEANQEFINEAGELLKSTCVRDNWALWHGDTINQLPLRLKSVGTDQAVFFLDAHFPQHYGYEGGERAMAYPTVCEVSHIVNSRRDHSRDVIVIDDLLVIFGASTEVKFVDQPGTHQRDGGDLVEIETLLAPTHHVMRVYNGGGHLVALPKVNPND